MASDAPKVSCSIDLDADGKAFGYLGIPHSRNDSGWGAVHLPIVSIRGGDGPLLVFTGGNHGDEYEGPIALMNLARSLTADHIKGQLIIIPALNFPAVMAGTRLSPIDGVNMNRAFPGRRDGTVTSMIAHFVHREILSRADFLLDIHSGGKSMMFSPLVCYHRIDDPAVRARMEEAVLAFAAPLSLELVELDPVGMIHTAMEDMGKISIGSELGGGGTTTPETVALAEIGARNLLAHFGVIDDAPLSREARGLAPTRMMHMPDGDSYIIAEDSGLYEVLIDLDQPVDAGDVVGRMHFPDKPERAPAPYVARRPGTLIGRTHKVLMTAGDFLALVAVDL